MPVMKIAQLPKTDASQVQQGKDSEQKEKTGEEEQNENLVECRRSFPPKRQMAPADKAEKRSLFSMVRVNPLNPGETSSP